MKQIYTYEHFNAQSTDNLESLYLLYKDLYYTGNSCVTDVEYDTLENVLKERGSKIINLVGYKISDYDFKHPSRMRSLSKFQMDENNNMFIEISKWYKSRCNIIGKNDIKLIASPKFDGNSVNIIVKNGKLYNIVTRGDGTQGKAVTSKLYNQATNVINNLLIQEENYEIRCEVVINKNLFEEKYSDEKANARNYVAGILSRDKVDVNICNELDIIPLQVLIENTEAHDVNIPGEYVINNITNDIEYQKLVDFYINYRISCDYLLDGIVLTFPAEYRSILGENDHDPEWATAIKFIPDVAISDVADVIWQIGKTGEFTPVVNIAPVELAGTIVKKASCYNAGYILDNKIGIGARIEMQKAGEIIPEVKRVLIQSNTVTIPTMCPHCGMPTVLDDIHLYCSNDVCKGKIMRKLADMSKILKIKGIGPAISSVFVDVCSDSLSLLIFLKKNMNNNIEIFKNFGFDIDSKSFANFKKAIDNFKEINSNLIFQLYNYNGLGETLSKEIAKHWDANDGNFFGHEKEIVAMFTTNSAYENYIKTIEELESIGINVIKYIKPSDDIIWVEMTGSPKEFGFKSKGEWLNQFNGKVMTCGLSDKKCQYLITDDINSNSSKMKNAAKKGIKIVTYKHIF